VLTKSGLPDLATAARRQFVSEVRELMLALYDRSQLLKMLIRWANDSLDFDNVVYSSKSKIINLRIIDNITDPDFAHACPKQFSNTPIDLNVYSPESPTRINSLPGNLHQPGYLFNFVVVSSTERPTDRVN
jgi:hypothetical protein